MVKRQPSSIWHQLRQLVGLHNSCLCYLRTLNPSFRSGIITSTVTNPIWVVKTRLQLQGKKRIYTNSLDCAWSIFKKEGTKGLYKGMSASYLGVAEGTIQWVIYENLKKRWAHSPAQMENKLTVGGKSAQGK